MAEAGVAAAVLTSMHNIAYYSGFLYCSFGRPYACVVTPDRCVTVSANIDGGQPWRRSVGENLIYTDWHRDNYWRAVRKIAGPVKAIGIEGDHLTLQQSANLAEFLGTPHIVDIAPATMTARMMKSPEEIALIREGAAAPPFAMRSTWGPAKSRSPRPGATPWRPRSRGPSRTPSCAIAGSGSSRV